MLKRILFIFLFALSCLQGEGYGLDTDTCAECSKTVTRVAYPVILADSIIAPALAWCSQSVPLASAVYNTVRTIAIPGLSLYQTHKLVDRDEGVRNCSCGSCLRFVSIVGNLGGLALSASATIAAYYYYVHGNEQAYYANAVLTTIHAASMFAGTGTLLACQLA